MAFFRHLPTIFYNGQQAKNLLARAMLTSETKKNLSLYYPYTIKDSDGTADVLAHHYYDDFSADWMIHFANEVVDPYFDLGLDQQNFDAHIKKKYGSIEEAKRRVAFYRTNWELLEDSSISLSEYDALSSSEKRYWKPVLDIRGIVNRYDRKKEDLIVNTNRILEITLDTEEDFEVGELVTVGSDKRAEVVAIDGEVLVVQHVLLMNTSNIDAQTLVGSTSGAEATVDHVVTLSENLTTDIQSKYWKAVSHYENEDEVNTLRRNVKMLDKRFKGKVEDELKRVMAK